jgi:sugar-phosphatase
MTTHPIAGPTAGPAHTLETRGFLFDMDGTLVDSTAVVEATWAGFARQHGADLEELLAVSHGRKAEETVARFGSAGIDVAATVAELVALELGAVDGIVEIPGAAAFLAALPADRVALVTSAPRALAEARMRIIGAPMPAVVVAAEDVVHGKPAPDPYLSAARQLGLHPNDVVVFEDADAGLASARAAGMRAYVVGALESAETETLPRVHNFAELQLEQIGDAFRLSIPGRAGSADRSR